MSEDKDINDFEEELRADSYTGNLETHEAQIDAEHWQHDPEEWWRDSSNYQRQAMLVGAGITDLNLASFEYYDLSEDIQRQLAEDSIMYSPESKANEDFPSESLPEGKKYCPRCRGTGRTGDDGMYECERCNGDKWVASEAYGQGYGIGTPAGDIIWKHFNPVHSMDQDDVFCNHCGKMMTEPVRKAGIAGDGIGGLAQQQVYFDHLKQHGITESHATEDSLVKIEDDNDDDTQVTVLDEWENETDPDVGGKTEDINATEGRPLDDWLASSDNYDGITLEDTSQEWWDNNANPSEKARILNKTGSPVENTFDLPSYDSLSEQTKTYLSTRNNFSFESKANEFTDEEIDRLVFKARQANPDQLEKLTSHLGVDFDEPLNANSVADAIGDAYFHDESDVAFFKSVLGESKASEDYDVCEDCGGKGFVGGDTYDDSDTCEDCGGTGRIGDDGNESKANEGVLPCPNCGSDNTSEYAQDYSEAKFGTSDHVFTCRNCGNEWESKTSPNSGDSLWKEIQKLEGESKASENFTFYEDASHGWLEVPKSLLKELGIADQISSYSYQSGDMVYLEEDADLSLFISKHGNVNTNNPQDGKHIRNYGSYVGESVTWTNASFNRKLDALESLGITQGDAVRLASVAYEDLSEDLKKDLELPYTEEDAETEQEIFAQNEEKEEDVDYNNIGESRTARTKYECEHCNCGFKSNESLSTHYNQIHAVVRTPIEGYENWKDVADDLYEKEQARRKKGGEGRYVVSDPSYEHQDEYGNFHGEPVMTEYDDLETAKQQADRVSGVVLDAETKPHPFTDVYISPTYNFANYKYNKTFESKATEIGIHGGDGASFYDGKTFTCTFCGKIGDDFSIMAQEICPSNNGNGHQVPIFGDQVKPKPIPTLSGESLQSTLNRGFDNANFMDQDDMFNCKECGQLFDVWNIEHGLHQNPEEVLNNHLQSHESYAKEEGTSDGAKKGWLTRKRGGSSAEEPSNVDHDWAGSVGATKSEADQSMADNVMIKFNELEEQFGNDKDKIIDGLLEEFGTTTFSDDVHDIFEDENYHELNRLDGETSSDKNYYDGIAKNTMDILNQSKINGFPFFAYAGKPKSIYKDRKGGITLDGMKGNPNSIKKININYDEGRDTFSVSFHKKRDGEQVDDVYFDQLSGLIAKKMGIESKTSEGLRDLCENCKEGTHEYCLFDPEGSGNMCGCSVCGNDSYEPNEYQIMQRQFGSDGGSEISDLQFESLGIPFEDIIKGEATDEDDEELDNVIEPDFEKQYEDDKKQYPEWHEMGEPFEGEASDTGVSPERDYGQSVNSPVPSGTTFNESDRKRIKDWHGNTGVEDEDGNVIEDRVLINSLDGESIDEEICLDCGDKFTDEKEYNDHLNAHRFDEGL